MIRIRALCPFPWGPSQPAYQVPAVPDILPGKSCLCSQTLCSTDTFPTEPCVFRVPFLIKPRPSHRCLHWRARGPGTGAAASWSALWSAVYLQSLHLHSTGTPGHRPASRMPCAERSSQVHRSHQARCLEMRTPALHTNMRFTRICFIFRILFPSFSYTMKSFLFPLEERELDGCIGPGLLTRSCGKGAEEMKASVSFSLFSGEQISSYFLGAS